jgi:hypothetical protein
MTAPPQPQTKTKFGFVEIACPKAANILQNRIFLGLGGKSMLIRARAPLRLGLAGGGTDVSPYCDVHGGYVLNATIDRYAYAIIKTIDEPRVRFVATDQQEVCITPTLLPLQLDGKLNLHTAVYNHIMGHYNGGKSIALELSTFCDAKAQLLEVGQHRV